MKNRKIVLLVIVILALFSFHNVQKEFYIFIKTKIQSYQTGKDYLHLAEKKKKRKRQANRVTFENNNERVKLIYFKLE